MTGTRNPGFGYWKCLGPQKLWKIIILGKNLSKINQFPSSNCEQQIFGVGPWKINDRIVHIPTIRYPFQSNDHFCQSNQNKYLSCLNLTNL